MKLEIGDYIMLEIFILLLGAIGMMYYRMHQDGKQLEAIMKCAHDNGSCMVWSQ